MNKQYEVGQIVGVVKYSRERAYIGKIEKISPQRITVIVENHDGQNFSIQFNAKTGQQWGTADSWYGGFTLTDSFTAARHNVDFKDRAARRRISSIIQDIPKLCDRMSSHKLYTLIAVIDNQLHSLGDPEYQKVVEALRDARNDLNLNTDPQEVRDNATQG